MENIILAWVLFMAYYSFLCCFFYGTSSPPTLPQQDDGVAFEAQPQDSAPEPHIDLTTLPLRPARKIASRLGIQQKANGKDQPLAWLRAQIIKKLEAKPQDVLPVVREVLAAA